jgi:hypothetical protein
MQAHRFRPKNLHGKRDVKREARHFNTPMGRSKKRFEL